MTLFYEKLLEVSDSSHVKTEEKMSRHTTFRAGGIQWLENFIATRANAVILVSHDRAFIDNICSRGWEWVMPK